MATQETPPTAFLDPVLDVMQLLMTQELTPETFEVVKTALRQVPLDSIPRKQREAFTWILRTLTSIEETGLDANRALDFKLQISVLIQMLVYR